MKILMNELNDLISQKSMNVLKEPIIVIIMLHVGIQLGLTIAHVMQDFEEMELIVKVCFELFKPMTLCPKLQKQNKFNYYMASVSGRSICQNRAF